MECAKRVGETEEYQGGTIRYIRYSKYGSGMSILRSSNSEITFSATSMIRRVRLVGGASPSSSVVTLRHEPQPRLRGDQDAQSDSLVA